VDFPGLTNKICVSRGDASEPEWSPEGAELFFLGNKLRTMMSARLKPNTRQWEEPVKLFDLPASIWSKNPWRTGLYDPTANGERFLMLQRVAVSSATNEPAKPNVRVVEHWFEEFREKK
jgi:hypothetical protein